MYGWLITNEFLNTNKFTQINKWFLNSALKKDIKLDIKTNAELMIELGNDYNKTLPDFVLFWDKDIKLAQYLENLGIKVFNNSNAIAICDDKSLTHLKLQMAGIHMPKTIIAPMTYSNIGYTNFKFLDNVEKNLGYPLIIKECFGSFGQQVYKVNNRKELENTIKKISGVSILFQEFITTSFARDIRLQVVGDKVVASMYRYNDTGDFRANITIGGKMKSYIPTKAQKELAIKCCKIIGLDFAGVDILFGKNDKPIVCEVNSNAHFKNIYDCTKINVGDFIIEHIIKSIERPKNQKLKSWLIYRKVDADYNRKYIDFYIEESKKLNIDIKLIFSDYLEFGIKNNRNYINYNNEDIPLPDFVIMRDRYVKLSKFIEDMGIKVYNNSKVSNICNDKAKTYEYITKMSNGNIKIIDSIFVKNELIEDFIIKDLFSKVNTFKNTEKYIIKSVSGHGGKQVFAFDKNESSQNVLKIIKENIKYDDIVIQPLVGKTNSDLRVYVIGKKIITSILRTAVNGFKSNFSLGGDVKVYELNEKEKEIINQIIDMFDFGMVGIDFIIGDNKELIFNEIEDVVGARMLYKCTNINLVQEYLKYIKKTIFTK